MVSSIGNDYLIKHTSNALAVMLLHEILEKTMHHGQRQQYDI